MIFKETELKGLFIINLEKREDERGFFARLFCADQFRDHGLNYNIVQINNSLSKIAKTLRGMHYQLPPKAEDRIVRCIRGAVYDMSLDLRPNSPTFGKSFGIEINDENRTMMYIPKGFAHGFLTLKPDTEFLYLVTEFYSPEYERIVRWNDPKFDLQWLVVPENVSKKDTEQGDFDPEYHLAGMDSIKE